MKERILCTRFVGLAVMVFVACGGDNGTAVDASVQIVDAGELVDAESGDAAFCRAPINSLDPACPEGGEVRIERVIGQQQYRFTAFFKSGQDDADTPAISAPGGFPSCFVCEPGSNLWGCTQVANRVYVRAGQVTISDGVANDLLVEHCSQGTFASGAYQTDECATGAGATGIDQDVVGRSHPDGAYIDQGSFIGTPVENGDTLINFAFTGDDDGYPAVDFNVYVAPDFSATPNVVDPVAFNDNEDLVLSWELATPANRPPGTAIVMTATFMDGPPTADEGPPTVCLLGVANPGVGEQSYTIPAATVATLPLDGLLLRGAATHLLEEYNDGTVRERRIDKFSMNFYSQPYSKNEVK